MPLSLNFNFKAPLTRPAALLASVKDTILCQMFSLTLP